MYLSLCNQLAFFKSLTFFLYSLFKGFCFSLSLEGKRFKFLINNFFLFFKMDTSHFKYLKFSDMFFLKKFKKNKRLIFYSFDLSSIKYNLLKIQKFKKPTKYKKKGLFLKNLY
jgi:ribosomal protein L6P/L9E